MILFLFYLSIFLIRLPPLLLPFGMSTNIFFRIIVISILFIRIFVQRKKLKITVFLFLSLIFFLSQGLSVWNAVNISNFFYFFEKISSAYIFLFVCQILLKKDNIQNVIKIIFIALFLNVLLELIFFFSPTLSELVYKFIHPSIVHMLSLNSARNRLFLETTGEIFVPLIFCFYFFKQNHLIKKVSLSILFIFIFLLAFWSNFRDRFMTFIFSVVNFILLFKDDLKKIKIKEIILTTLIFIIVFILGFVYINTKEGFTVIDRLLLQDKEEDVSTLTFRKVLLDESIIMIKGNPLFGVGLGNFYEHLPQSYKNGLYSYFGESKVFLEGTLLYPHNIFAQIGAESGLFGLFSFTLLIFYFIKLDISLIRKNLPLAKSLILCFWLLMFYAMLSPKSSLLFFSTFFMLRSAVELYKDS